VLRPSVLFGALFFGFAGCKPSVGSSCDKGEARCLDGQRALVCQSEHFIETPCRGPKGCRSEAKGTACDVRSNRAGDSCSTDEEGAAVCADGATLVACRRGAYVRVACRGKKGCVEENGHALCDATVAERGEACATEEKKACGVDARQVLACSDGQMQPRYDCRGPRGCAVTSGKIDCDQSTATLRDACDLASEGSFACSEDGARLVRCTGGSFVADETCKAGQVCVAEAGSTRCAKPQK
jgi:hypothetical protein